MVGLITDRTERNVLRRKALSEKGWATMTAPERVEWTGDPMTIAGANLIPPGPFSGTEGFDVKVRHRTLTATTTQDGSNIFGSCIIGDASDFVGKTLTLSVGGITSPSSATPRVSVWWEERVAGRTYAGASLSVAGSMTFNTADYPNTNGLKNLVLRLDIATNSPVTAGTTVRFDDVMLEVGDTPHKYVPYTEVVATEATKGAYNYSDLNRVGRAVSEISDIAGLGLKTKTDWTMWDIPEVGQMDTYLSNIVAIKSYFGLGTSLPTTMSNLNYTSANNIEIVLRDAYAKATGG